MAERYDKDLIDEMGYVAPAIASQLLQGYVEDQHIRILDAGCGTGLVGADLHQNGYLNLEGLDYSVQMLEKAKDKGVYTRLHQGDLTGRLDLPKTVTMRSSVSEHLPAVMSALRLLMN